MQTRKRIALLVVSVLLSTLLVPSPVQAQPRLQLSEGQATAKSEIQKQWQQAQKLAGGGELEAASETLRKTLAMQREFHNGPHADIERTLDFLTQIYEAMSDFVAAEDALRQQLAIREQLFGRENWRTNSLRIALEDMQRWQRLSTEQRRQLNTADQLEQATRSLYEQGEYREAIIQCQRALEIRRTILGAQHQATASSLSDLAEFYSLLGDYAKAEPLYRQGLAIRKKVLGKQHPQTASTLNELGLWYESRGEYTQAESFLRQGFEICQNTLGEQHAHTIAGSMNLAGLCMRMGEYTRAESLLRTGLENCTNVLGDQHPQTITCRNSLAVLYEKQGHYAKAEPLFRQCLEYRIRVLGKQHPETANSLNNLAGLYQAQGDYLKAEPLFQQSLEIRRHALGETHPDTAASLNNLASLYSSLDDYEMAASLLAQSYGILTEVFGETHPTTITSLDNLAVVSMQQGDYVKAEPLCERSLDIRTRVLGDDHPATATSLSNLAVARLSLGDAAEAEQLFLRSLKIRRQLLGEGHPDTSTSLDLLAGFYCARKDHARADALFQRVLRSTRASLENAALVQSERQQLVMSGELRYQLDNYLSMALFSKQHDEPAFRQILAWKGATLVRQRQMREVAKNTDLAPLFQALQQTATRLATMSRLVPEPEKHAAWQRQISALTEKKERLESELSRLSAEFRKAKEQVSAKELLTALPPGAVLIDFLEYRRNNFGHFDSQAATKAGPRLVHSLLAFVVRDGKPTVLLDLGAVAPLSEAIDTWRRSFGTSRDGIAAGRLLRERIWEPLEQHLDRANLILVSTDGALGRLPLAALPSRKVGRYLLEDYRLAMLPVPQLLPALISSSSRSELGDGLLVMGDVDYDADPQAEASERENPPRFTTATVRGADTHFSHLPGTIGEIATITHLFSEQFQPKPNKIKTLKLADATEQQFRHAASRFPNLHLATHGFFAAPEKKSALAGDDRQQFQTSLDRDELIRGFNPGLLSGLVFSGANRKPEADKDDGILTADEIAALSLEGADLVVLSACETGLGEVAGGEGVLGVQRAFQVAGARSTVASLWQVGDVATQLLMERFYRNYWEKKMSKLDALREAQLYLLNHPELLEHPDGIRGVDRRIRPEDSDRLKRLSPQFWAAFSLSGDWR